MTSPASVISLGDPYERVLELAHAALSGLQSILISARYGLAIPADRVLEMDKAIHMARQELVALERLLRTADAGPRVH